MNEKAIELTILFLTMYKDFEYNENGKVECEPKYKKQLYDDIMELLQGGLSPEEIEGHIRDAFFDEDKQGVMLVSNLLSKKGVTFKKVKQNDPDNLLVFGKFYLHHELHITSPTPKMKIVNGRITRGEEEPFFQEIVGRYTFKEVLTYLYKHIPIDTTYRNQNNDEAIIKKIYQTLKNNIDLLLYTIDATKIMHHNNQNIAIRDIWDITKFIKEGNELLSKRQANLKERGILRVIPRTRTEQ